MDHVRPEASVIIPAFNAARWLPEQLDALARQVEPPRFEVLVSDNGSTDGTRGLVEALQCPFEVRWLDASGTQSAAYARNIGASAARSAILLFCDADDLVSPNWARSLVDAFRGSAGALVAGAVHHERFNDAEVRQAYEIGPDVTVDMLADQPAIVEPGAFANYLPSVTGASFAIDRETYLAVGGMDASFPGGSEETDFSWRVQRHGTRLVSAPNGFVHYRLRSTARGIFRQQRIQQRARIMLWVRYRDTPMTGPSWRMSLLEAVKSLAAMPFAWGSRQRRLSLARRGGGHIGALEGMMKYRILRRVPAPLLWGGGG